jgi:hypothetical protein
VADLDKLCGYGRWKPRPTTVIDYDVEKLIWFTRKYTAVGVFEWADELWPLPRPEAVHGNAEYQAYYSPNAAQSKITQYQPQEERYRPSIGFQSREPQCKPFDS